VAGDLSYSRCVICHLS